MSFILSVKSALLGWQDSLSAGYIITFRHVVKICQSELWCSVSWECDKWYDDWRFRCFLSMPATQELKWNQTQVIARLFAWESLPSFTFHTWGFVLLILNKKKKLCAMNFKLGKSSHQRFVKSRWTAVLSPLFSRRALNYILTKKVNRIKWAIKY